MDPQDPQVAHATLVFPLDRARGVRRMLLTVALVCSVLALGAGFLLQTIHGPLDTTALLVLASLTIVLPVVAIAVRATRKGGNAAIELLDDVARLPKTVLDPQPIEVRYDAIVTAAMLGTPRALLISTGDRNFVYPAYCFARPSSAEEVLGVLRERIGRLPEGSARLVGIDQRAELLSKMVLKRPLATYVVFGVLIAIFAFEYMSGAVDDVLGEGLIRLGANASILVRQGQWFRLVTANFLHMNELHILVNGASLVSLGAIMERLLGRWTFLAVYLGSGVVGAAVSALMTQGRFSVGASGAIFGLLGSLGAIAIMERNRSVKSVRVSGRGWILTLGINALLPIVFPMIDIFAHAGGFISGGLLTLALIRTGVDRAPELRPRRLAIPVALLLLAANFAAIAAAGAHAQTPHPEDDLAVETDFVENSAAPHELLNNMAWMIAVDPRDRPDWLALAQTAIDKAIGLQEHPHPVEIDTAATVAYRRGDLDRAIDTERKVLKLEDDDKYATQLARFLEARRKRSMRMRGVEDRPNVEVKASLEVEKNGSSRDKRIRLETDGLDHQPFVLYITASSSSSLYALIEICASEQHADVTTWRIEKRITNHWPDDVVLAPAMIDLAGCERVQDRDRIRAWAADPEYLKLP
jgi:rhomboid protease GluP